MNDYWEDTGFAGIYTYQVEWDDEKEPQKEKSPSPTKAEQLFQ